MNEVIFNDNLRKLQRIAVKHGVYFVRSDNENQTAYSFYSLKTDEKRGSFTFEELTDFLTAAEEGNLNYQITKERIL